MSKYYLFFIFDYCNKETNKRRAHVVRVGKKCNIKSIIDDYKEIKDQDGNIAALEIIAYFETETKANETAETWNTTYLLENRLFK